MNSIPREEVKSGFYTQVPCWKDLNGLESLVYKGPDKWPRWSLRTIEETWPGSPGKNPACRAALHLPAHIMA